MCVCQRETWCVCGVGGKDETIQWHMLYGEQPVLIYLFICFTFLIGFWQQNTFVDYPASYNFSR